VEQNRKGVWSTGAEQIEYSRQMDRTAAAAVDIYAGSCNPKKKGKKKEKRKKEKEKKKKKEIPGSLPQWPGGQRSVCQPPQTRADLQTGHEGCRDFAGIRWEDYRALVLAAWTWEGKRSRSPEPGQYL